MRSTGTHPAVDVKFRAQQIRATADEAGEDVSPIREWRRAKRKPGWHGERIWSLLFSWSRHEPCEAGPTFRDTTGTRASRAPLAPALMMGFWMLLGAASGIKLAQTLWQLLGWGDWAVSVAVPVGGKAGALVGAHLGLITRPRLLVLLMAVFAGASAGGVAGNVAWGEIVGIGGQVHWRVARRARLGDLAVRQPWTESAAH